MRETEKRDHQPGNRVKHCIRILGRQGDTVTRWETGADVETDVAAQAAIREAERIFAQARARGDAAFIVEPGQRPAKIEHWDQRALEATEIIITPRLVGGSQAVAR